jgi:hypothetical protein
MPACPTASARGADNGEHARAGGLAAAGHRFFSGGLRLVGQLVLEGRLGRLVKRVVLRFGPGCHRGMPCCRSSGRDPTRRRRAQVPVRSACRLPRCRPARFNKKESWRWRGRWYLQCWPSRRAMAAVRERIRQRIGDSSGRSVAVGGECEPGAQAVGSVLPLGQPRPVLLSHPVLRPRASGPVRERQVRALRAQLDRPVRHGLVPAPRGIPPQRQRPLRDCACLAVTGVGKPGAGEPHARFETGPVAKARATVSRGTHDLPGNLWD